jgi:hypothetical protein
MFPVSAGLHYLLGRQALASAHGIVTLEFRRRRVDEPDWQSLTPANRASQRNELDRLRRRAAVKTRFMIDSSFLRRLAIV